METTACRIRLSSSSVSTRSEFHTRDRSVVLMSGICSHTLLIFSTPSARVLLVRNTAQSSCITRCILSRTVAVELPPSVLRNLSRRARASSQASAGSGAWAAPGVTTSFARSAAARPKTTRSIREFDPNRFAPCTDTQAASPTAIRPGTIASGLPSFKSTTSE